MSRQEKEEYVRDFLQYAIPGLLTEELERWVRVPSCVEGSNNHDPILQRNGSIPSFY